MTDRTPHGAPDGAAHGTDPAAEAAAFERLSAADPARGSADPDLSGVRTEVVAAAVAQGVPGRRRSMLLAAGAAAAVAVLAGSVIGGVVVGRATAPEPGALAAPAGDAPVIPIIALQNRQMGANGQPELAAGAPVPGAPVADTAGSRVSAGSAPLGSPSAISADAKMSGSSMPYGWWGNQIFAAAPDVSADSAGSASGYLMSAQGVDRLALAQRLAAEFGVAGTPQADEWGNVTVGPTDGSGPSIWIGGDALAAWSYYNPSNDPWRNCVYEMPVPEPLDPGASSGSSGGSDSGGDVATSDPAPSPSASGAGESAKSEPASCDSLPMPDRERSERTARTLLAGVGVPADAAAWDVSESSPLLSVSATQLVDGMRSALTWSVTFADGGVYSAYGSAAGLQEYPGYPVVSPREAIERTSDPRWRALSPTMVWSDPSAPIAAGAAKGAESTSPKPAPLKDGRPAVQVPITTVTLSGGELALAQYWQNDGTVLLLPAYTFTDEQGNTWSIIAVTEDAVDFSTP